MTKIPKSFKLFSTTVNVVFDDNRMNDLGCVGLSEIFHSRITLSKTRHGDEMPADTVLDTFYHEKIHMILDSMNETKLSGNEKFIEVFAKLLRQADETMEF